VCSDVLYPKMRWEGLVSRSSVFLLLSFERFSLAALLLFTTKAKAPHPQGLIAEESKRPVAVAEAFGDAPHNGEQRRVPLSKLPGYNTTI
jgi:hypothetical protein